MNSVHAIRAIRACAAWTAVLAVLLATGALRAGESATRPYEPDPAEQRFVAEVGPERVDLSLIMETWLPVQRKVHERRAAGQLDEAGVSKALQEAWQQAVETAVREELFYQEARRDMANEITSIAGAQYQSQNRSRDYAPSSHPYLQNKIADKFNAAIEEIVQNRIDYQTKRAGGIVELHRILAAQGLNWETWRMRIYRRALTDWYLHRKFPFSSMTQVRPKAVRDYYKDHPEEFTIPGAVSFRHVFVDFRKYPSEDAARERAGVIYDTLTAGELSFTDAAAKFSDDAVSAPFGGMEPLPKGGNGPDALDSRRQAWLADIRLAVQDTAPAPDNQPGAVLVSTMGCHLVQVIEKSPSRVVPFAEAQERIGMMIQGQVWEVKVQGLDLKLRDTVRVQILMPEYPKQGSERDANGRPTWRLHRDINGLAR